MIGELEKGVFVATGHGPWVSLLLVRGPDATDRLDSRQGITLAPGTGKIVSELMFGRALSADISKLGLDRFAIKSKL